MKGKKISDRKNPEPNGHASGERRGADAKIYIIIIMGQFDFSFFPFSFIFSPFPFNGALLIMFTPPFSIGEICTNAQIIASFHCACEGGIRPANSTNSIVLVLNHTKMNHEDDWQDGILFFRGSGSKGNQTVARGVNKSLLAAFDTDRPVYLFEVFTQGQYTFKGRVKLECSPFQKEENGRIVWIFPLKPVVEA